MSFFPREQLHLVLLDDLVNDANDVMADHFTFVGVRPIPIDVTLRANVNPDDEKSIPAALRDWLVEYYRDDISFVEQLLDRDLSSWRRPATSSAVRR